MANNISGKVVNEIEFKINKKSWDNLTRFQQKITNVKRQLSGLNKSIKVQAVVNSINKVTSATGRASQKMYDAHTRAYEKHVKDRNRIEQQIEYRTQGTQMAFARRMTGATPTQNAQLLTGRSAAFASIATANAALRDGTITLKQYNQQVNHAVQSNMRLARVNSNAAFSFKDMRSELVQLTAAYTAFAAGVNIFQTGKEFDSLQAGMRLFAKDDAGVKDTMSFLRSESERLGTNFEQAAQSFTKFAIVARNKMSKEQTRELFTGLSEYATVMQIDQYRFQRSMMAIQQMMSKGKISSEELRLQLAENLPGSVEIFATAMGMSEAAMFKQMEQGKLLAEDVLPKVAKEYARVARENGALEKAQEKVNSQYQRFLNALTDAKVAFFEGGFGKSMASIFQTLAGVVRSVNWADFGALIGGSLQGITDAINVLTLPLRGLINLFGLMFGENGAKFVGYAAGLALVTTKILSMTRAVMLLVGASRALSVTPIGLGLTALALGGMIAMDKYMIQPAMANPVEKLANSTANRSSQQINVVVRPDGSEFGRAVRANVASYDQEKNVQTVSSIYG